MTSRDAEGYSLVVLSPRMDGGEGAESLPGGFSICVQRNSLEWVFDRFERPESDRKG